MREFVDELSELDVLTFDQRLRRILMLQYEFRRRFVIRSFVAEFVDEFVTCGQGYSLEALPVSVVAKNTHKIWPAIL